MDPFALIASVQAGELDCLMVEIPETKLLVFALLGDTQWNVLRV